MCGIAGATRNLLGSDPHQTLHWMNDAMLHRGPDMGEIHLDEAIGLCHRRLSIIDLSEDGRQPMSSSDGRFAIVFNGEIYNFPALRKELEKKGHLFRSRTDTEVLLALYQEEGTIGLQKIRGMYAYAIWDKEKKELFAARDRIGKKPLYFFHDGDRFAFASEIKSLLAIPSIKPKFDPTALVDYLKYLFIPHPKSIYSNIHKLAPGHFLLFKNGRVHIEEYWDVDFSETSNASEEELTEELLTIIEEAVQCRLLSDVPLGAFLSGGIDSSGVVALMNRLQPDPVITCTIGFKDKSYNEAEEAKTFAFSLGARHHEYYVEDEPAQVIKKLVWHFDEPFADSSMVPTYYVSQMARKNVTVALSGDGGDENFAGYGKYAIDQFENRVRQHVPSPLLRLLASFSGSMLSGSRVGKKLHSLSSSALLSPAQGFYVTNTFISDSQLQTLLAPELLAQVRDYDPAGHILGYYNRARGPDHLAAILYTDLKLLLPGDFLVKVDRMSMANSLEVRSPLLDQKVIEFAARIPSRFKLHGREKKYILKNALRGVLPSQVLQRKKHGFESPINKWFRHELRSMAETYLLYNEAMASFFNIHAIKQLWEQHQTGKQDHGTLLWTLFVFALWQEQWIAGGAVHV